MKKALITGITGQDGSYLAELLLEKGYEVHGIIRRASTFNTSRIDHIYKDPHDKGVNLFLHYGDITDSSLIYKLLTQVQPDEVYNLAAQSHVRVSFDMPEYTGNVTALGVVRLLEAIRVLKPDTKFYQASSSEMFGKVVETPQKETTPFYPRSPYGVAKLYGHWITVNYRESYDMFACSGILFNHESPRRGETFVTRKISRGLARIKLGKDTCLYLGNLDAKRDWGFAKDYVEAMWLMLQQDQPEDFVIATGVTTTVRDFIKMAFAEAGAEVEFKGEGVAEIGIIKSCDASTALKVGQEVVCVEPKYFRPTEVELLIGDATKAKEKLGWEPKCTLQELVKEMVAADIETFNKEKLLKDAGYDYFQQHD